MTRFSRLSFILAISVVSCMFGQEAIPGAKEQNWRGAWAASAGARTFHGRWWAQLFAKPRDGAYGSWTLLSDSNQIILEGTWSAQKSSAGWRGTWSARIGSGKSFSGSWNSDVTKGNIFEDMLKQTLEQQVTGAWQSGRMQGNWWLMGPGY